MGQSSGTHDPSRLTEELKRLSPDLVKLSHDIHARPELGGDEQYAVSLLIEILAQEGFEVQRPIAGLETAFLARKALSSEGPRIAFLAEYDALPGLGHACGHNWIAGASLGAALSLARVASDLGGEVLLIGTPGEENLGGKVVMTEQGVFADIDAAMMVHPSRRTQVDRTSLANCQLEVEFTGKTSHAAASPEAGINALDAARLLFAAVDMLKRSLRDDVRLPGIMVQGGAAANVIPDRAVAQFSLRALDRKYLNFVRSRVEECAQGAALATRTEMRSGLYEPEYDELISNSVLVRVFREQLARIGVEEFEVESKGMGSVDIGNVSHVVPAIHPDMAIAPPEFGGHTVEFRDAAVSQRADEMMLKASDALAGTGLALLSDSKLLQEAHEELRRHSDRGADA